PATPLATLLAGNPALSATTASQVQAMALEGPNGTPGTPATLGGLAVAALAGLGVRYRVTSRLRGRERDTHHEPAESGTGGCWPGAPGSHPAPAPGSWARPS